MKVQVYSSVDDDDSNSANLNFEEEFAVRICGFKRHLTNMLIHNDDVLFCWSMVGFDYSDNERCLQLIVDNHVPR